MSTLSLTGAGPEAAGGGAFTPASISGLMAWYDLSLEAGADASALSSVTDRSGNGRTLSQATGTNQPVVAAGANGINSLKTAKFDGVNDFMATASFASPTAGVSVFAVVQWRVVPAAFEHVALHAAQATWTSPFARWCIRCDNTGRWDGWANDAVNDLTGSTFVVATAAVHGFVYDQTHQTHYKDGATDGSSVLTGVMTSSTQPLVVGSQSDAATAFFDGKLGELVVYDNGISAGNITSLSTYFRSKWATP